LGFDANWGKGLDIARERFSSIDGFNLIESDNPNDIPIHEQFDISICMETFEHIREDSLLQHIEKLSKVTGDYLYVTVPKEFGLPVFIKFLYKLLKHESSEYSFKEMFYSLLGMLDKVERTEHKGFDYRKLIMQLNNHFEIVHITKIPFPLLTYNVGVVCKKR
jgi:2-polyprenyl-3-methyl-5-hydroxy-6-metoxy-1,4-benzoquinol methylase